MNSLPKRWLAPPSSHAELGDDVAQLAAIGKT